MASNNHIILLASLNGANKTSICAHAFIA